MSYVRRELTPGQKRLLGQNLRAVRKRRDISTADVMAALHIAPSQLSLWETGTRAPEIYALMKLAALYDCPVDALLVGVDPAYTAIVRKRLPLNVQDAVRAMVDSALLMATEAMEATVATSVSAAPEPTAAAPAPARPTTRGKSAPTRARRAPKKK